jgi:exopolyphosphatase / guanosine-5'-triphosphate,3'-diphosphate pyrophosphatase
VTLATADTVRRMERALNVAVLDVGSNTVRLLVATRGATGLAPLREEREHLLLGEEVERLGRISDEKLAATARCAGRYARVARGLGVDRLEVIVTAPGRQSENADELVQALAIATGAAVRVLSADEEGRLAYRGAVAAAASLPETVAVCDVGGGSTELVVGTPTVGPTWWRSMNLGCVRLTERFLVDDPPGKVAMAAAAEEVERQLKGLAPPVPLVALATGGTARALRKVVGETLGAEASRRIAKRSSREIAKANDLYRARARTLPAGALVLAALQRRLGVPFVVSRAGLREGVALELLATQRAA